jgi:hypothetical protein
MPERALACWQRKAAVDALLAVCAASGGREVKRVTVWACLSAGASITYVIGGVSIDAAGAAVWFGGFSLLVHWAFEGDK